MKISPLNVGMAAFADGEEKHRNYLRAIFFKAFLSPGGFT